MSVFEKSCSVLLTLALAACASSGSTMPAADTGPAAAPAQAEPAPTAAADPAPASGGTLYSDEQADRGRNSFRALCTECHYSNEFSDAQFKFKWSRRSAGDLYDVIYTQMPESAPGSLSPEESAGLLAYMLRMNGFEAGPSELSTDQETLDGISLAPIRN